jgi:hypothetical protein
MLLSVYRQNAENNNSLNVSWLSAVGATIIIVARHGLLYGQAPTNFALGFTTYDHRFALGLVQLGSISLIDQTWFTLGSGLPTNALR